MVRKANEDNWLADPENGLFIVADGMGGEFAGELASQAVIATVPGLVIPELAGQSTLTDKKSRRVIEKALKSLSEKIQTETKNSPGLAGMGSTVVCAFFKGTLVLIAHMGDSRAYRVRSGSIELLTLDHTLVQMLIDSGDITPEQAETHPCRGNLTRHIGMEGEALVESHLLKTRTGDLFLLCSDGLNRMLNDEEILEILKREVTLETKCQLLIEAANKAGGEDNVTAVLISIDTSDNP
jgi:protein phosphatase